MKLVHPASHQSNLHLRIVRPEVITTATPPRSKFLALLAGWAEVVRSLSSGMLSAFALPEHQHRTRAQKLLQANNLYSVRLHP